MAYHIALDVRFINSGTGTYAVKMLEYLQQIDSVNRYTVIVPEKDLDYWRPTADNFTLLGVDIPMYSLREQFAYKHILDNLNADLVHFVMPQQPLLYRGKKLTTIMDMTLLKTYNSDKNWLIYHIKQLVGKFVWKRIAHTSDYLTAISANTKREYQEFTGVSDDKISVIYPAAEVLVGNLTPYDVPFRRFIVYVGQQPDYKNIRRLGEAHQKLLDKHPDLGLVLVGRMNADTQANKEYFEAQQYKNIHFTGFIPDTQRDWLYTQAAAYVFPSLMEGFGLPPLEAMAYGTPVVSSNASCMPEILGEAAEYFDPLDTDAMAAAIERVLSDDKLRATLIKRGHQQVAKYSWRELAEQTHQLYMRLLEE